MPDDCFVASGTFVSAVNGVMGGILSTRPGALVPARVTRLMRHVTEEWLVVRPAPGFEAIAAANGFTELTVTPGHETLDAQGRFRPIIDILNDEAELVLADGTVMRVVHERVVYEREDVMPQAFIAAQALASRTKPSTGISSARAVG